jgi:hypothetical protein
MNPVTKPVFLRSAELKRKQDLDASVEHRGSTDDENGLT